MSTDNFDEGATKTDKPIEPIDQCPRMVGFGKHHFHWKDFGHSNVVVCINCGQERDRTMTKDTVIHEGVHSFPE